MDMLLQNITTSFVNIYKNDEQKHTCTANNCISWKPHYKPKRHIHKYFMLTLFTIMVLSGIQLLELESQGFQHCCRDACHISERLQKSKPKSHGSETSWDLAVIDRAQQGVFISIIRDQ